MRKLAVGYVEISEYLGHEVTETDYLIVLSTITQYSIRVNHILSYSTGSQDYVSERVVGDSYRRHPLSESRES